MTDQRFKIVFSGELMPDASLETVKDNLARLFKSEPGKIDALFGGRPVVLKRELPEAEAERYLTALRQAGANAYKEVDLAASLSLVETPDHNPQVAEETPAQDLPPMTCPKCGHEQPSGAECSACGVIIEKYLARQAQLGENAAPATTAAAGASPYTPPSAQVGDALPEFGELNVFTTNGRIGRLRYLGWSMAMTLCFLVIMGLGFLLGETVGVAVTALASIAFIVIAVMIGVQRLHDLGWSGWLWLLNFVPFVGSVFGILMLVLPGSTGANRYGPPPPANSTGVKVLASLIILLPIVGIIAAIALPSYQGYLERANYDGGASAPADPYTTDEQAAAGGRSR
ncbi:membrane protein [Pseudomonas aeruginosa]|nr:membrane protein [Pseudomonas aeruginosa]